MSTENTPQLDLNPEQVSLFWDVLSFFYRARSGILMRYRTYQKKGTIEFDGFDELITFLERAKTGSHELFRAGDTRQDSDDPKVLFDFVLSTIYHESLHMKEYVYILHTYESVHYSHSNTEGDSLRQWVGEYTKEIFKHARLELPGSFSKVAGLFESCEIILGHLLPRFDRTGLGRIAYCSRASAIRDMFGSLGIVKFYDMMYVNGAPEGFALVGTTFVENGFYLEGAKALMHMIRSSEGVIVDAVYLLAQKAIECVEASEMPSRTKNKLRIELHDFTELYSAQHI